MVSNSLHNDDKKIFDVSNSFAFPVCVMACGILAYPIGTILSCVGKLTMSGNLVSKVLYEEMVCENIN